MKEPQWVSGVGLHPISIIQAGSCLLIIISFLIAICYLKWDIQHLPYLLLLSRSIMMLVITYFGMKHIFFIIFVIFDQLIFKGIAISVLYNLRRYTHACICILLLLASLDITVTWFIDKTDSIRLCSNLIICILLITATKRQSYLVLANILIIMNVLRLYKYHHGLDTLLFTIGENTCIALICIIWTASLPKDEDIPDFPDDYLHEEIPQDEVMIELPVSAVTGTIPLPPLPSAPAPYCSDNNVAYV